MAKGFGSSVKKQQARFIASELERLWMQPQNRKSWDRCSGAGFLVVFNKLYKWSSLRDAAKLLAAKHLGIGFVCIREAYKVCPVSAMLLFRDFAIPYPRPDFLEFVPRESDQSR